MPSKKRKLSSTNTTGYRGVSKRVERFRAEIRINKKKTYLGTYDTPKEAVFAYDRVVIEYNLPKDKLNFPHDNKTSSTSSEDEDEFRLVLKSSYNKIRIKKNQDQINELSKLLISI